MSGDERVQQLLLAIRTSGRSSESARSSGDPVLAHLEPVARQACRAHLRYLRDEIVDDLVQRTLEVAWNRIDTVHTEDRATLERWVRGIARNVCRNDYRLRRDTLTEDGVFEVTDPNRSVLSALQAEERDEIVQQAIETLPAEEQDVVFHRYVHDLTQAEIAEIMGLPDADAVRKLLQNAKRHLKVAIDRRIEELGHTLSFVRDTHSR